MSLNQEEVVSSDCSGSLQFFIHEDDWANAADVRLSTGNTLICI